MDILPYFFLYLYLFPFARLWVLQSIWQLEMLARAVLADDAGATQEFFTHAWAGSMDEISPRPCAPAIVQR